MKKVFLAVSLLLAGCSAQPIVIADAFIREDSMPLDQLLRCSANALRIYDLPPRIAILLSCEREIAELEAWAANFAEQTGLTLDDVEYIISEASAN